MLIAQHALSGEEKTESGRIFGSKPKTNFHAKLQSRKEKKD